MKRKILISKTILQENNIYIQTFCEFNQYFN